MYGRALPHDVFGRLLLESGPVAVPDETNSQRSADNPPEQCPPVDQPRSRPGSGLVRVAGGPGLAGRKLRVSCKILQVGVTP